jgi:hypothetical protein
MGIITHDDVDQETDNIKYATNNAILDVIDAPASNSTNKAAWEPVFILTENATYHATWNATMNATRDATRNATRKATRDATRDALKEDIQ